MNRVSIAIENVRPKLAELATENYAELEEAMAVTFDEHFQFQELQAQAHASGKLTTEEAQVVYVALGESVGSDNGGWTADVDLATKVVVTQLMSELLAAKLERSN